MPMAYSDARVAEVWDRLASVTDPELDESVTELRFVTAVEVDAESRVHIGFRLPTYWCSPNFAFLMADDMRAAAGSLPWVRQVLIDLHDHMYSDTINQGLAEGRSFKATFAEEAAEEDLDDLRRTFRIKAYQRRQEAVIRHLMERGLDGSGHPGAGLPASRDAAPSTIRKPPASAPAIWRSAPSTAARPTRRSRRPKAMRSRRKPSATTCPCCAGSGSIRSSTAACAGDCFRPATAMRCSAPDGEPTLADFIAGRVATRNTERGGHDSCRK